MLARDVHRSSVDCQPLERLDHLRVQMLPREVHSSLTTLE